MNKLRIAIADDHDLFRQGMKSMLEANEAFQVVVDESNGRDLLVALNYEPCDVLILDLDMPELDGFGVLEALQEKESDISTLIVSMHHNTAFVSKALRSGAKGFLPKNCDFNLACEAIRVVRKGGYFFDKATSLALAGISTQNYPDDLTEREVEVIQYVCEGKTTQEIADELYVSRRTVDGYRNAINVKTKSENLPDLVIYAVKHGLIDL
jgi:DNA-binding NarL/FixJ family response regulator